MRTNSTNVPQLTTSIHYSMVGTLIFISISVTYTQLLFWDPYALSAYRQRRYIQVFDTGVTTRSTMQVYYVIPILHVWCQNCL